MVFHCSYCKTPLKISVKQAVVIKMGCENIHIDSLLSIFLILNSRFSTYGIKSQRQHKSRISLVSYIATHLRRIFFPRNACTEYRAQSYIHTFPHVILNRLLNDKMIRWTKARPEAFLSLFLFLKKEQKLYCAGLQMTK